MPRKKANREVGREARTRESRRPLEDTPARVNSCPDTNPASLRQKNSRQEAGRDLYQGTDLSVPSGASNKGALAPVAGGAVKLLAWQRRWLEDDSRFKFVAAAAQAAGKSFVCSLEMCLDRLREDSANLGILLSASDRQSVELMEKVKMHTQAWGVAIESGYFENTSVVQHVARFPNGKRLIALPANPDTARGYSGDLFLDEFALHRDSKAIWAAGMTRASRGYKVRVASTFKGTDNKFYELAKDLGLHTGIRPESQPVRVNGWSGYWVDIFMAHEQGAPVDPEAMRQAIGDDEIFLQDYGNVPMCGAESFIPLELILSCESGAESSGASLEWDGFSRAGLCAGFDVARKRDLSVIAIGEPVAGLLVVRGMIWMPHMKFADQKKMAREVAAAVEKGGGRFAMDATGIGAQLAEELAGEFPCVEPVEFGSRVESGGKTGGGKRITAPVKERMAADLKRRFEERTIRIPEAAAIRRACQAVKRYIGPTGAIRFDAAHTDAGHADEFWALAMLSAAATTGRRNYGPASTAGLIGKPVVAGLMERVF
jgi:phage FluMu gp28-like protein